MGFLLVGGLFSREISKLQSEIYLKFVEHFSHIINFYRWSYFFSFLKGMMNMVNPLFDKWVRRKLFSLSRSKNTL